MHYNYNYQYNQNNPYNHRIPCGAVCYDEYIIDPCAYVNVTEYFDENDVHEFYDNNESETGTPEYRAARPGGRRPHSAGRPAGRPAGHRRPAAQAQPVAQPAAPPAQYDTSYDQAPAEAEGSESGYEEQAEEPEAAAAEEY